MSAGRRRVRAWPLAIGGLAVLLVVDQARFVLAYSRHWVNEDQTLLWLAARDLGRLRVPQPSYYGQAYLTTLEALPAEIGRWIGVPLWTGVPVATALLVVGPWFLLAAVAWARGRHVASLVALAIPIVVRDEFLVSSESPGGRGAGVALAMTGTAVLLLEPTRRWVQGAALAALALGTAFNPTVLVLTAAVAAWVLVAQRSATIVAIGVISAIPAVAWLAWVRQVIEARPDYNLHGAVSFTPRFDVIKASMQNVSRYIELAAPEVVRTPVAVGVAVIAVGVAAVLTRRPGAIVSFVAAVAALGFLLSSLKAMDGTVSAYLSFGRYVHLLPAALWFVAYLIFENVRLPPLASAIAPLVVLAALGTFVVRQVTFQHRFGEIATIAANTAGAPVAPVGETLERCRDLRQRDVELVVFRRDRTGAYACGALLYGDVRTLFPEYDRRAWDLRDEAASTRDRFLVTDADTTLCDAFEALGLNCAIDDGYAAVSGRDIVVLDVWRDVGEPIRPFGQGPR